MTPEFTSVLLRQGQRGVHGAPANAGSAGLFCLQSPQRGENQIYVGQHGLPVRMRSPLF